MKRHFTSSGLFDAVVSFVWLPCDVICKFTEVGCEWGGFDDEAFQKFSIRFMQRQLQFIFPLNAHGSIISFQTAKQAIAQDWLMM